MSNTERITIFNDTGPGHYSEGNAGAGHPREDEEQATQDIRQVSPARGRPTHLYRRHGQVDDLDPC
jgi:hypothetical protein